jgi:outer membrane protein TolC
MVVWQFLAVICCAFSQGTELSETALILRVQETSAFKAQQAQIEGTLSQSQITQAQFQPQLTGSAKYGESKEDPLFQFSPVLTPTKSSAVGVSQKLPIGLSAKIEGFTDQISIPAFNVNRVNRTGARVNLELDLFSNFLGRRDWSELKSSKIKKKVANLQSALNQHGLVQDFRKVYWSYMGLEESYKIAEELLQSATKQMKEIQSRKKVGAADLSDVAQTQAQVSNRQTQLSVISFQKAQLFQQLKMQYSDITTIPYQSTVAALQEVEDCIVKIKAEPNFGSKSDFSQLIDLLQEDKRLSIKKANTISDWDVKLQGQYQKNAVGQGFETSKENFLNMPKEAYQVGIQVSVPLGSSLSKAEKHTLNQVAYNFESQIGNITQSINTQHQRALESLSLLEAAVRTQTDSVKSLRESVVSTRRKYSQARISQIEYILEQDKLYGTEVESIQNRLQIINETLEYLKTFNKQQCRFNKVTEV